MGVLLTDEAIRLLRMEDQLRRNGMPVGGVLLASPATFKRDLRRLRCDLGAVVVFDFFDRRYRLLNANWTGVMPHILAEANAPREDRR